MSETEWTETSTGWTTVAFAPAPTGWRAQFYDGAGYWIEPIAGWLTQENRHAQRRVVAAIAGDTAGASDTEVRDTGELVPASDFWANVPITAIYSPGQGESGRDADAELDLPRQLRDALETARRLVPGDEVRYAAFEMTPRRCDDHLLRTAIEHAAETLRTRPVGVMPDGEAKRAQWGKEHMSELARGVAAGDALAWRQRAGRAGA